MALECAEHGHEFGPKDKICVAKRGNRIVAFCEPLLRSIPRDEQSAKRGFGTVGIYTANAKADPHAPGTVTRSSLKSNAWLFSLPVETLKRYLPKVYQELNS